jgi:LacI family transcriptional regulator
MNNRNATKVNRVNTPVATIGIVVRHTPTLADVAAEAQVHIGTASRALNDSTRDMVKPETARRVQEAAFRLGYSPNVLAGSLRSQKTASIGVVLPDLTNPFLPPIVRGIEDVLTRRGYVALIGNTDNDPALELKLVETLRARRVDGFIIATSKRNHPILEKIAKSGTSIVLINRTTDRDDISSVISDDAAGIRAAVNHLVELGHKHIVHLAGPTDLSTGRDRATAFLDAMHENHLPTSKTDIFLCEQYSISEGYAATKQIFATRSDVTALVAANDRIAVGVLQALRDLKLSCPDEISVVGFNDMPFVDLVSPPLTTVRVNQYAIGTQSAELLLDRLADSSTLTKTVVLPVKLIIRGSTGPRRTRHSTRVPDTK